MSGRVRGPRWGALDGTPAVVSKPREPRLTRGETFEFVRERGETFCRCRACAAMVPPASWWGHVCPQPADKVTPAC